MPGIVGSLRILPSLYLKHNCHFRGFRTASILKVEDLYKVLGLSHNATQKEIKDAFYALSKLHHPDTSGTSASSLRFHEISDAYEILGDPKKRTDYDRGLIVAKTSSNASPSPPPTLDPEMIRKADVGSFEANYVRSYNRNRSNAWTRRADAGDLTSAFDIRASQRSFATVSLNLVCVLLLSGYVVAKICEKPIPTTSDNS